MKLRRPFSKAALAVVALAMTAACSAPSEGADATGPFDVLFIGGSTDWKLGAAARGVVKEAKARGKRVHMGRVNSLRRYRYAEAIGCDTVDGPFLTFGPDKNLGRLRGWINNLETQPQLNIFGGMS